MANQKIATFHIGEQYKNNVRKYPFVFNGIIDTEPRQYAKYDFDSILVCNDSAEDVFYSLDGGNHYQKIKKLELQSLDLCTFSENFWMYCGANTAAVRVTLWRQD
jgi:hypothetical protein